MSSFGVEAESLADDLLITDPVGRVALRDGVPDEDEVLRLARAGGGPDPTQRQDQAQSAPPTRQQLLPQWTAAAYPGCGYGSGFPQGQDLGVDPSGGDPGYGQDSSYDANTNDSGSFDAGSFDSGSDQSYGGDPGGGGDW